MKSFADGFLADRGAAIIAASFDTYRSRRRELTEAARVRFERREWLAAQRDAARRLDLYTETLDETLDTLGRLLGNAMQDRPMWTAIRAAYASAVVGRVDVELAETFFNSVTRRVFHTVGVDPSVEFVVRSARSAPPAWTEAVTLRFNRQSSLTDMVRDILRACRFDVGFDDLDGDAERVADVVTRKLVGADPSGVTLARPVFFRGRAAYLVGKLHTDAADLPFLLALDNPKKRVVVDAVLLDENEISIVFSFARSYFAVDTDRPAELVAFLRTIMPRKPVAELYNAIGWNKHGKTELFRSILRHLATTDDRFEVAPGQRGMVMCVFTLPRFDVVFKVMRDRFDPPKTVTHQEVMDKYRLVFRHDRAGRLVDAQEFEHLEFARDRFSDELLEMLSRLAAERVRIVGDRVVLRHLYTERRLNPLDVYLRDADTAAARDAVIDYGQVLRDLAATNIFPGDMLLKNFGVSRHGRLIFYDYDELCLLTECRFRELPVLDDDDGSGEEPSFYVGERDIFPEEFRNFLGLSGDLLAEFLAAHEELLDVRFWHRMQEVHRRGEVLRIYPYRPSRCLRRGPGVTSEGATLSTEEPTP